MNTLSNDIKFFVPVDITKGKDKSGNETMKFKGRANSNSEDSEGEILDPSGFELDDFKIVNWNHAKTPDMILGEPTKFEVKDGHFNVEGELYNEVPQAVATYNLMKALKKRGKTLGISVEGKVIERESDNPSKIKRAKITGIALTPNPIHKDTFAELVEKGYTPHKEWEYDIETEEILKSYESGKIVEEEEDVEEKKEKAIDTGVTGVIGKESVEHKGEKRKVLKKIAKSDIYDRIFSYFYPINIVNVKEVYSLINKVSQMEKTEITDETIQKAFDILNKVDEISKGDKVYKKDDYKEEKSKEEYDEMKEEGDKKDENKKAPDVEKSEDKKEKEYKYPEDKLKKAYDRYKDSEDIKKEMYEDGYDKTFTDSVYSYGETQGGKIKASKQEEVKKSEESLDELTAKEESKAIEKVEFDFEKSFSNVSQLIMEGNDSISKKFSALGEISKSQNEEIESLKKSLGDVVAFNDDLKSRLNKVEKQPNIRKSVTTSKAVERFEKSKDGNKVYSLSDPHSRKVLMDSLEELSGINKGGVNFDRELMTIAQDIEISKSVNPKALGRLNAMGIEVIK